MVASGLRSNLHDGVGSCPVRGENANVKVGTIRGENIKIQGSFMF